MHTLSIDIETYSSEDLTKSGVYRYAEAPDFSILLFGYAFNDEPVQVVDLACGNELPKEVLDALLDASVLKTAWNAAFEITCISSHFNIDLDVTQWECSMVKSAMLGLPLSLDMASKVLQLPEEKMKAGKALIRYFSLPCKATKANQGRTRNLPHHDPDKWNLYKEYNGMDVEVERAIRSKIAFFEIPEQEKQLWYLDQKINKKGVLLDMQLVNNAIEIDELYKYELEKEAKEITGLENPNSGAQLKTWLSEEMGEEIETLRKGDVPDLIKNTDDPQVIRLLELRQEMSKTSVKKYQAMSNCYCLDKRARGLIQFYGANRTGRFSGRLIQLQNLPQNHLRDLDLARNLVLDNELDILKLTFGNIPDTLSQLIRTAFVAPSDKNLYVADFSSIELIVAAYLAGEMWVIKEFTTTKKIYEQTAARMLNIPVGLISKDSPERQKGKIASLACQYGGGVGALENMGAIKMGIDENELPHIIKQWRIANPNIVKFWYELGSAAIKAVENKTTVHIKRGVKFEYKRGILFMCLPSGRKLSYLRPHIGLNKFDSKTLKFEGMDQVTKQWKIQDTYGGKLFENLCQAVARDCLAFSLLNLDKAGYEILTHVHDEVVIEAAESENTLNDIIKIMTMPIPWAPGLPLAAEGFVSKYYKK